MQKGLQRLPAEYRWSIRQRTTKYPEALNDQRAIYNQAQLPKEENSVLLHTTSPSPIKNSPHSLSPWRISPLVSHPVLSCDVTSKLLTPLFCLGWVLSLSMPPASTWSLPHILGPHPIDRDTTWIRNCFHKCSRWSCYTLKFEKPCTNCSFLARQLKSTVSWSSSPTLASSNSLPSQHTK